MNVANIIKGFFDLKQETQPIITTFRIGQIINAKVLKIYPNQTAEVQIGSQKIIAQLEASLSTNELYWFQVGNKDGKILLKMLEQNDKINYQKGSIEQLISQFSLPSNKVLQDLIRFFLREELPITKEFLIKSTEWLNENTNLLNDGFQALKYIITKNLPFTKNVFLSILSIIKNDSFHLLLENMKSLLLSYNHSDTGNNIRNIIDRIIVYDNINNTDEQILNQHLKPIQSIYWEDTHSVKEYFINLTQLIGYSYEHDVIHNGNKTDSEMNNTQQLISLKPLLLKFLNENPPQDLKEVSEKLVHKITGFQALSQEIGPIEQVVFQLPITIRKKSLDLTIQWTGQKTANGSIDSNYCRVLFYLNLEYLKETIVDMQVQNRIMNITVMNDNDNLKKLALPFIEVLKENVRKINYKLSSVQFIKPATKQNIVNKSVYNIIDRKNYNGLDIKI